MNPDGTGAGRIYTDFFKKFYHFIRENPCHPCAIKVFEGY